MLSGNLPAESKRLKPGERVRIKAGPFVGKEGIVLKYEEGRFNPSDPSPAFYWITIQVRAFGGKTTLTFNEPDDVEQVAPA